MRWSQEARYWCTGEWNIISVFTSCSTDGVSRSAAVVINYLMRKNNMNYQAATSFLLSKRSVAQPNKGYASQLQFLGSEFFSYCNSMDLCEQFKFWQKYNGHDEMSVPSEREFLLEKELQQEKRLHEQTKEMLDEVTDHAEEGKKTLKELVHKVQQYMVANPYDADSQVCHSIVPNIARNTKQKMKNSKRRIRC